MYEALAATYLDTASYTGCSNVWCLGAVNLFAGEDCGCGAGFKDAYRALGRQKTATECFAAMAALGLGECVCVCVCVCEGGFLSGEREVEFGRRWRVVR